MNAFNRLQAVTALPLFAAFIAFRSFTVRLLVIPFGKLKLYTSVIRNSAWSTAPNTVTVKLPLDEFPAPCVAVQLTVVSPIAKVLSEVGVHETVGASPESSVAVAA